MSTPLQELMESEEMAVMLENNQEIIDETNQAAEDFVDVIAEYVYRNPDAFIDDSVENIIKNVRVFSEVAMAQFLTEVTTANSQHVKHVEPLTPENALDDYI